MMFRVAWITLFLFVRSALADPELLDTQIYSHKSKLTVGNINKAVEKIRDPTRMSPNFRQAMKNLAPQSQANPSVGTSNKLPNVQLAGNVWVDGKTPSVVLTINGNPVHIKEGATSSTVYEGNVLTVRVDEITQSSVAVTLVELNKLMILH